MFLVVIKHSDHEWLSINYKVTFTSPRLLKKFVFVTKSCKFVLFRLFHWGFSFPFGLIQSASQLVFTAAYLNRMFFRAIFFYLPQSVDALSTTAKKRKAGCFSFVDFVSFCCLSSEERPMWKQLNTKGKKNCRVRECRPERSSRLMPTQTWVGCFKCTFVSIRVELQV